MIYDYPNDIDWKSMVDLHSLDDGSLHDLLIIVSDNDEHDKEVK